MLIPLAAAHAGIALPEQHIQTTEADWLCNPSKFNTNEFLSDAVKMYQTPEFKSRAAAQG